MKKLELTQEQLDLVYCTIEAHRDYQYELLKEHMIFTEHAIAATVHEIELCDQLLFNLSVLNQS